MIPVCVVILSYNHEKFIAQAIDSVLMQKVNFTYKIIIADDKSTDNTVAILRRYKEKYPDKIDLVLSEKNSGVLTNMINSAKQVNSCYVALLDGDDYWNDEEKLQAQFDFLEQNKAYSGCFHNAEIIQSESASKILFNSFSNYAEIYSYKPTVYPWDLTNRLILPTSSLFISSDFLTDENFKLIDDGLSIAWKITCLAIKYKKFHYIKAPWSTYRNHMQGISKSRTVAFHLSHIHFLKRLIKDAYYRNIPFEIWQSIASEYYILLNKLKEDKTQAISLSLKKAYIFSEINKMKYFLKKIKE